ncbi:MAG: hypothetical protein AB1813_15320 [Verrucomicrobiota bacterium]
MPVPSQFSPVELKQVGLRQREIILLILIQLLLVIPMALVMAGIGADESSPVVLLIRLLMLVIGVFNLIFVYRLASALGETPWLYVVASFIPMVGLFALLLLNSKATRALRNGGLNVGLLGVSRGELERAAEG